MNRRHLTALAITLTATIALTGCMNPNPRPTNSPGTGWAEITDADLEDRIATATEELTASTPAIADLPEETVFDALITACVLLADGSSVADAAEDLGEQIPAVEEAGAAVALVRGAQTSVCSADG